MRIEHRENSLKLNWPGENTVRFTLSREVATVGAALGILLGLAINASAEPPKLILQVNIDQLRGDLPQRFLDRMGKGGFRYLLEKGVVYADAHHRHAMTETIVGHTTLATGAYPAALVHELGVALPRAAGELRCMRRRRRVSCAC